VFFSITSPLSPIVTNGQPCSPTGDCKGSAIGIALAAHPNKNTKSSRRRPNLAFMRQRKRSHSCTTRDKRGEKRYYPSARVPTAPLLSLPPSPKWIFSACRSSPSHHSCAATVMLAVQAVEVTGYRAITKNERALYPGGISITWSQNNVKTPVWIPKRYRQCGTVMVLRRQSGR
jgi:hypothetical protein